MEKLSPREGIEAFLSQQHVAVAGYSNNPKKFGTVVFNALKERGYQVYAVNPKGGSTPEGNPVYDSVESLPEYVKALVVVTRPEVSAQVVNQALKKGLDYIWIQQMSDSTEVLEKLEHSHIHHVLGRCILLHANPKGIHKFHRLIVDICGRLPK